MLLVRVIPSFNKEQNKDETTAKQNIYGEEDFYEKYGDLSLGYSPIKKQNSRKINKLYRSIKNDSNLDQKFE